MRANLIKAGACVGVAVAIAVIGWMPGGGQAEGATTGPPSVVLRLPNTGTGLNDGKDVRVRASVTCANATPGPVTVSIAQQRGSRTVKGTGQSSARYRCNGRTQHVGVLVHAKKGFFVPGAANATADVQVCNSTNTCVNGHDARAISLVAPRTTTTSTPPTTTPPTTAP
jgi:hypothetical protein